MTSTTGFHIWNIDILRPSDPVGNVVNDTFLDDPVRHIPDLEPGFKIRLADNITAPIPDMMHSEQHLRLGSTLVSQQEKTSQSDLLLRTRSQSNAVYGTNPIIDVPSYRNPLVNEDGVNMSTPAPHIVAKIKRVPFATRK